MVVSAVLAISWLFLSGQTAYIVQIDFTWAGDFLEGADVEIDGEVVGQLQKYGTQFVSGFEVEAGQHTVRVQRPDCEGRPDTITLGMSEGRRAVLMADVDDGFRCRIVLR